MTSRTDRDHKTAKELFLEQAAAYFDDLTLAADHAPYGQVFNHAEAFCVKQGRELISLQGLMQDQIETLEKKWINALSEMQNKKKTLRIQKQEPPFLHRNSNTGKTLRRMSSLPIARTFHWTR